MFVVVGFLFSIHAFIFNELNHHTLYISVELQKIIPITAKCCTERHNATSIRTFYESFVHTTLMIQKTANLLFWAKSILVSD